jgi:hypothetical protein
MDGVQLPKAIELILAFSDFRGYEDWQLVAISQLSEPEGVVVSVIRIIRVSVIGVTWADVDVKIYIAIAPFTPVTALPSSATPTTVMIVMIVSGERR